MAGNTSDAPERHLLDDRAVFFVAAIFSMYIGTCVLGTCILEIASRIRGHAEEEARPLRASASETEQATVYGKQASSFGRTQTGEDSSVSPAEGQTGLVRLSCTTSSSDVDVLGARSLASQDQPAGLEGQRRAVQVAFAGTFLLCLGTTIYCMQADLLTKATGLTWEAYAFLFGAGCVWQLLQAIAAGRNLQKGRRYPLKTFAVATISGVWPVLSDSYDTMKDTLFGGLCLQSTSRLTTALGLWTWIYLLLFHGYFFASKRDGCIVELASNHLAVWVAPTVNAYASDHVAADADASSLCSRMWQNEILPLIYKQVTPTKRFMLAVENVPQGVVAVIYVMVEGGSPLITVLNLCIPAAQIVASWLLFAPVRRAMAGWYARQLDIALEKGDELLLNRLLAEADFQEDEELLKAVAEHCDFLEAAFAPEGAFKTKASGKLREHRVSLIAECLAALSSDVHWLELRKYDLKDEKQEGLHADVQALTYFLNKTLFIKYAGLRLVGRRVGDQEAKELARLLPRVSIPIIYLEDHDIHSAGYEALIKAAKQSSVQQLHLFPFKEKEKLESDHLSQHIALAKFIAGNNSSLTRLDLSCWEMPDAAIEVLTISFKYIDIGMMDLRINQIGGAGVKVLAACLKHNVTLPLQILKLRNNRMDSAGLEALAKGIASKNALRTLDLQKSGIDLQVCKALGRCLVTNNMLEQLNLAENQIRNEGVQALAGGIEKNGSLRKLNLQENNIGLIGSQELAKCLHCNMALHELNLASNKLGDEGAKVLAGGLQANLALQKLELQKNEIGTAGSEALAYCLSGKTVLQQLNLAGNHPGDKGAKALILAAQAVAIKQLHLAEMEDQVENNKAMAQLLAGKSESLHLARCKVSPPVIQVLATAMQVVNISELNLENSQIDDNTVKALAEGLVHNATLKTLGLQSNAIGAEGSQVLAAYLEKNTRLEKLFLQGNQISDPGVKELIFSARSSCLQKLHLVKLEDMSRDQALAQFIASKSQTLDLSRCTIPCAAVKVLATAVQVVEITELRLASIQIGGTDKEEQDQSDHADPRKLSVMEEEFQVLARGLKSNDTLKVLDLQHNNMGPKGIEALAPCLKQHASLESLSLAHCEIGKEGAKVLAAYLSGNTRLQNLSLQRNGIGDEGVEALVEGLNGNTCLQMLDLQHNSIGHKGIKVLACWLKGAKIRELLMQGPFGDDGLEEKHIRELEDKNAEALITLISEAEKSATLQRLQLVELGDVRGDQALAEFLAGKSQTLDLARRTIPDAAIKVLTIAFRFLTITELSLANAQVGDIKIKVLAQSLQSAANLLALDLQSNGISTEGSKELAICLAGNVSIQKLTLSGNNFGAQGVKVLAESLSKSGALLTLDLKSNNIGAEGSQALAALLEKNSSVQQLRLARGEMGVEGAQALAEGLKSNTTVRMLDLQANSIGALGCKALAESLRNNDKLQMLDLQFNGIGAEGSKALAAWLEHSGKPLELFLQGNEIPDEGAQALAEGLLKNATLEVLGLQSNHIGTEGSQALAKWLTSSTKLQKLYLQGNSIGGDGAKALMLAATSSSVERIYLEELEDREKSQVLGQLVAGKFGAHTLDFASCQVPDAAMQVLATATQFSTITELRLANSGAGDSGIKVLTECLAEDATLESLGLQCCNITDRGAKALASWLKEPKELRELFVAGNAFGDEGVKALMSAVQSSEASVQKIYLVELEDHEKSELLAQLFAGKASICSLDLSACQLPDDAIQAVIAVARASSLQMLYLLKLGSETNSQALAEVLANDSESHTLDLSHCEVPEPALKVFEKVLPFAKITELDWSNAQVGIAEIKVLRSSLGEKSTLQKINLAENKIDDEGSQALAEGLRHNGSLKRLDLRSNSIGSTGSKAIARCLSVNKALLELILGGNQLDATAVQVLREAWGDRQPEDLVV